MKKSFTYFALLLIAAVILTSCHSSSFMMKRHYTKGYYVSHRAKVHNTKSQERVASNRQEMVETVSVLPQVSEPPVMHPSVQPLSASSTANKGMATSKMDKSARAALVVAKPALPAELSLKKPFRSVTIQAKSQKSSYYAGDDALSLFWIVILVLLILWALGLIGGLGYLVNLLLLVALILLILWLLRIL